MKNVDLSYILRGRATVVALKELLLASGEGDPVRLKRRLSYYVQQGQLYWLRRGLYAKDSTYDRREVATKIFTPAYVSFETILVEAGVIFQHYNTIFVASYQTREVACDGQNYSFRKIKDSILTSTAGLELQRSVWVASKERAFLDLLYLNKDYHFDNLAPLDFNKIKALLPLYANKRMAKKVQEYFKKFHDEE